MIKITTWSSQKLEEVLELVIARFSHDHVLFSASQSSDGSESSKRSLELASICKQPFPRSPPVPPEKGSPTKKQKHPSLTSSKENVWTLLRPLGIGFLDSKHLRFTPNQKRLLRLSRGRGRRNERMVRGEFEPWKKGDRSPFRLLLARSG